MGRVKNEKHGFAVLCALIITANCFPEDITGTWYRNIDLYDAVLVINDDMEFSIEAVRFANFGQVEGKLIKVEDGHYISHIDDNWLVRQLR
jgi:hypothetical protein